MSRTVDAVTLAQRIRSARIGAGLSQGDLAKAIGVKRQAANLWERPDNPQAPKGDRLVAIAAACGVRLEELTEGSARLNPPASAPALKTWVSQRMAGINQGLNEYMEAVINAEVDRRLRAPRPGLRVRVIPLEAKFYDRIVREAKYQAAAGEPIAFVRAEFDADYLYYGEGYQHPPEEPPQEFGPE